MNDDSRALLVEYKQLMDEERQLARAKAEGWKTYLPADVELKKRAALRSKIDAIGLELTKRGIQVPG